MADKKISQLTAASTPVAGTEVFPAVQSGSTVKVSIDDLFNRQANYLPVYGADRATTTYGNLHVASTSNAAAYNGGTLSFGGKSVATGNQYVFGGFKFSSDPASGTGWGTYASLSLTNDDSSVSEKVFFKKNGDVTALSGNFVVGTAGKGIDFSANANAPGMTSELLTWYEEGVFTLTDSGVKDAVLGTWTFVSGTYTRIGRQVTINATFSGTGLGFSANTGYYRWDGLPFASAATHSGTWQGIEAFKACAGFAFTAGSNIWLHAAITTQTSDSGIVLTATYTV